jgi:hypothetical protein
MALYNSRSKSGDLMDLQQLLRTLEEFIYEIALWPIMLPRTLWRFAFRPLRIEAYVRAELDKPAESRYSEYMSPILLWLLVGFAPCFITALLYAAHAHDPRLDAYLKEPLEVQMAAVIIFSIWPPLTFAVGLLHKSRTPVTRESLRHPFYTQSMFLAPFYLFGLAIVMFIVASPNHDPDINPGSFAAKAVQFITVIIAFIALIGEGRLLRSHAPMSWGRAIGRLIVTWIVGSFLACVLEGMGLVLLAVFREHGK